MWLRPSQLCQSSVSVWVAAHASNSTHFLEVRPATSPNGRGDEPTFSVHAADDPPRPDPLAAAHDAVLVVMTASVQLDFDGIAGLEHARIAPLDRGGAVRPIGGGAFSVLLGFVIRHAGGEPIRERERYADHRDLLHSLLSCQWLIPLASPARGASGWGQIAQRRFAQAMRMRSHCRARSVKNRAAPRFPIFLALMARQ